MVQKINLEGTASHVVRKGKRINVTVTVENYGKEKSEPVRLQYVETGKKAGLFEPPGVAKTNSRRSTGCPLG